MAETEGLEPSLTTVNSRLLYLTELCLHKERKRVLSISAHNFRLNGGSSEIRTHDPQFAGLMFSQLNYEPINLIYFASLRKTSSVNVSRYRPRNFFCRFYPVLLTCRLFIKLHLPQLLILVVPFTTRAMMSQIFVLKTLSGELRGTF